jgi:hypothetical protein
VAIMYLGTYVPDEVRTCEADARMEQAAFYSKLQTRTRSIASPGRLAGTKSPRPVRFSSAAHAAAHHRSHRHEWDLVEIEQDGGEGVQRHCSSYIRS